MNRKGGCKSVMKGRPCEEQEERRKVRQDHGNGRFYPRSTLQGTVFNGRNIVCSLEKLASRLQNMLLEGMWCNTKTGLCLETRLLTLRLLRNLLSFLPQFLLEPRPDTRDTGQSN